MANFSEGRRVFHFDDDWEVIKYDDSRPHSEMNRCVGNCKAVDFAGIFENAIYLIEVKDYSNHERENRQALRAGEVAKTVSVKVKDTLASAISAARRSGDATLVGRVGQRIARGDYKLHIVFVAEVPDNFGDGERKAFLLAQTSLLEQRLAWLPARISIVTRHEFAAAVPKASTTLRV